MTENHIGYVKISFQKQFVQTAVIYLEVKYESV